MTPGSERRFNSGMQVASFVSNLLGHLYTAYAKQRAQSQAGDAYQNWQSSQMQPSTATQSGAVQIENPMGGKPVDIPTFETKPPQMGPVDSNALTALYGAMAGVNPEAASPYLDLGRQLYGVQSEDSRYRQQRGDAIADRDYTRKTAAEDRDYDRTRDTENRGFTARTSAAGALTGKEGRFDIANPQGYIDWLMNGGGELMPSLAPRPEQVNALGVIQGKGGAFIPYQQGNSFGGASVTSDIPLKDPTIVRTGNSSNGMSDADARGLTDAYAEQQIVQQQLSYIAQQEAAINQALKSAKSWDKPKLQEQLAQMALKKIEIQGALMRLNSEIQTRETGQVVRPGTQTTAPQNPY